MSRRAKKLCSHVGCTNVQPCPKPGHTAKPWSGSARDRGQRISGGRRQARARYVIDRADTICHVCGYPGSDEADHIVPLAHGGADTDENMGAIHREPCHREKTAREAQAGNVGQLHSAQPRPSEVS